MSRPSIKKLVPRSAFPELLAESVTVVKELNAEGSVAACKLTAAATRRQAHKNAYPQLSAEEAEQETEKLEAKIAAGISSFQEGEIGGVLRRMVILVKSPNWPSPPSELRRLNFLLTP